MAAVWTRAEAGLLAQSLTQTLAAVANTTAAVHLTRKIFVARQTTRNVLQVARDVAALLVVPHAPLLREVSTGRTLVFTVAVVKHGVVALVPPGAGALTLRRFGSTGDGGVQHRQPTVAGQLIEARLPAGFTVASMTRLLAAVEATVQLVATNQRTLVLVGHAAQLSTFVSATRALLVTAPLAGENQLIFFKDHSARNFLHLSTTSALNRGRQGTRPTDAFMTKFFTQMNHIAGATGQGFAACFPTGRDGVGAAPSFGLSQLQQFSERSLATGTGLDATGGQRAGLARSAVTRLLAPVSFTVQHLGADVVAGEVSGAVESIFVGATRHSATPGSAVTHLLDVHLAGLAGAAVTHLFTGVFPTVQRQATDGVAAQRRALAAANRTTALSTDAGLRYKSWTLRTRPRVTQDVTGVSAVLSASLLSAHVAAAVWDLTALPLRICHFTTEAGISRRGFERHVLTGRTTPTFSRIVGLRRRGSSPLLDAVQVEDVEAAVAAPDRSHGPDHVTANHALVLLLGQLLDQAACLRLVALRRSVVAPRSGPGVLMMRSPLPSTVSCSLSLRVSRSLLRRLLSRSALVAVAVPSCGSSLRLCGSIGRRFRGFDRPLSALHDLLVPALLLLRLSSFLLLVESPRPLRLSVVDVLVINLVHFSRSPVRGLAPVCGGSAGSGAAIRAGLSRRSVPAVTVSAASPSCPVSPAVVPGRRVVSLAVEAVLSERLTEALMLWSRVVVVPV